MPQWSWPTTLRPLIANVLAESPSVRMSVQRWLFLVPASLASVSLPIPVTAEEQEKSTSHVAREAVTGMLQKLGLVQLRQDSTCAARPAAQQGACANSRHLQGLQGCAVSPVTLLRLEPSLFLSSFWFLNAAKLKMLSITPHLATLSISWVVSSALLPKLLAFSVRVSLVCGSRAGAQEQ